MAPAAASVEWRRCSLRGAEILAELRKRELAATTESQGVTAKGGCSWVPEYGAWMVEATPANPYSAYAGDLVQCVRSAAGAAIHVSRIDLHAPPMNHAHAWSAHLLPKLYAFAAMVGRFRDDSALRMAYLCADEPRRTRMLLADCPFLASIAS